MARLVASHFFCNPICRFFTTMSVLLLQNQHSERLLFEAADQSQYDQWLPFFQDPATSVHWVEERQSPEVACTKWYDKQRWRYANNRGGMNALFEKATGKLVGYAGLLVQVVDGKQELEIGYSLLPACWHRGYATEAARKCKEFAGAHRLSPSLISIISLTNLPSQKVALRNGMAVDKQTEYSGNKVLIFRIQCPPTN